MRFPGCAGGTTCIATTSGPRRGDNICLTTDRPPTLCFDFCRATPVEAKSLGLARTAARANAAGKYPRHSLKRHLPYLKGHESRRRRPSGLVRLPFLAHVIAQERTNERAQSGGLATFDESRRPSRALAFLPRRGKASATEADNPSCECAPDPDRRRCNESGRRTLLAPRGRRQSGLHRDARAPWLLRRRCRGPARGRRRVPQTFLRSFWLRWPMPALLCLRMMLLMLLSRGARRGIPQRLAALTPPALLSMLLMLVSFRGSCRGTLPRSAQATAALLSLLLMLLGFRAGCRGIHVRKAAQTRPAQLNCFWAYVDLGWVSDGPPTGSEAERPRLADGESESVRGAESGGAQKAPSGSCDS